MRRKSVREKQFQNRYTDIEDGHKLYTGSQQICNALDVDAIFSLSTKFELRENIHIANEVVLSESPRQH